MEKITVNALTRAINEVESMDLVQAEKVLDDIHTEQPNLLASVLVQQNMGNTLAEMEVLLDLLIISHLALKYSNVKIRMISEEEQEKHLKRYIGHLQFIEGLSGESKLEAIKDFSKQCSEQYLLAYVTNEVVSAGFTTLEKESGKYLVMTAGVFQASCHC